MVRLDRFEITFDNSEEVYFAGQEVTGKIIIENSEPKKVNEVLMEIKGRSKTYWTKHSGKSRRHCSCSETYFCEQFNTKYTHQFPTSNSTSESTDTEKGRVLPAGVHEISFSYTLPKALPSSFEGERELGYVRYTCKVTCERPWDFDIVCRKAFTVLGIEDINEDTKTLSPSSAVSEPNDKSEEKSTKCCPFFPRRPNHSNAIVEISVKRSGYTPGEVIKLQVGKILNQSGKAIKSSSLKLSQHVSFKAKTFSGVEQSKQIIRVVARVDKREIPNGAEFNWTGEKLRIPSIPPKLSKCKIIEVTYVLELETSSGSKASLPITIGTIPLLSDILSLVKSPASLQNGSSPASTTFPEAASNDIVQVTITDESGRTRLTNPSDEGDQLLEDREELENLAAMKKRVRMPSSILSELYPTLPSPYYRESCFGGVNIAEEKDKDQYGEKNFAPKYPFFCD